MIRMKIVPLAVLTAATIFGGIMTAKAVGYYETTASKEPVKFKTGELAGLPNPADIRGSYTWQDIEKAFGIPAAEAAAAFSVPGHALDPATRVSTLEEIYAGKLPAGLEIGTGAVRVFVSLYTGLPMEIEEGSVLPDAALALLAGRPGADVVALEKLAIPTSTGVPSPSASAVIPEAKPEAVPVATPAAAMPAATPSATPVAPPVTTPAAASSTATGTGGGTGSSEGSGTSATASSRSVVGKTTFGDLYDWGLNEAQVAAVLGYKPGPRTQSVRDSAIANGREFSEFRTALQSLVDKTAP